MSGERIYYREGYAYQLVRPFVLQTPFAGAPCSVEGYVDLDHAGVLTVSPSYAWDGASGARDTPSVMRASLVHDSFAQLAREGFLPRAWFPLLDDLFITHGREDGVSAFRAWYMRHGLKRFGEPFAMRPKPILVAPREALGW